MTALTEPQSVARRPGYMVLPIAAFPFPLHNRCMSLDHQKQLDRRLRSVFSRSQGPSASALFGRSCRLLNAAHDLEREAGRERDSNDHDGAVAAIESMAPTLEAIANASLLLSLLARELASRAPDNANENGAPRFGARGDDSDHPTRLLFGASQNIRIAAEAARLAAEAVRPASPSTGLNPAGADPPLTVSREP
jgi:hypothetical protein